MGIKFYPCQYSQYLILVKKLELLLNKSLEIEYTMSETMKDGIALQIPHYKISLHIIIIKFQKIFARTKYFWQEKTLCGHFTIGMKVTNCKDNCH
jgi:hypothetical protein